VLWICEIFWDDFLNYNVTHAGRVGDERGGGKGDERRGGESGEKGRGDGQEAVRDEEGDGDKGEEWQDTDTDASGNEDQEDLNQEIERPKTPSQQTGAETEKVDSVMQGQLYQREASSTAWDEGASPKARSGYTRSSEDELGFEG
jgi:hypothetical protein